MGFPILPNSVFGIDPKDEPDIFNALPLSMRALPKLMPDKIEPNKLDKLPIASMPLSIRGALQDSEPSRLTVWPLASGIPPKLMPSNYRPNDIFHQSPALKRTGGYSSQQPKPEAPHMSREPSQHRPHGVHNPNENVRYGKPEHIFNPDAECFADPYDPRNEQVPGYQFPQPEEPMQPPRGNRCEIKSGNQYGIAPGHYVIRNNALYDLNGKLITNNPSVIRNCLK